LHYYYRLRAIDVAGNSSGWAVTDVSTDDVTVNGSASSEASYMSTDSLASVQMPAGVAASEISCNISSLADVNGKQVGTASSPVVLGPYQLACKTTAGSIVTEFKKPVTWTLNLTDKLKRMHDPVVYAVDAAGKGQYVKTGQFDSKDQSMRVVLPVTSIVVVRASTAQGISLSFVSIILVICGIIAAIVIYALNRKKKLEYEEYLRSKYYEL
jgi:hypothetical protein